MIVWMLTGLWHGASWNFIFWGLLFGVLLCIEKYILLKPLEKLPKFISHFYALFIVMISFIIFSSESVLQIKERILGLFGIGCPLFSKESIYYLKSYLVVLILGIIGSTPLFKRIIENKNIEKKLNILKPIYILLLLTLCTSYIVNGSFNPFLYFRF